MAQEFRLPEIVEIARRDGRVTVERLAEHFGVTLQTIRRDLSELAQSGRLERVHGGAVLPSGTANIGYEDRRALNADAKAEIGHACAGAIPHGQSVFMNIGTTTEAVARQMLCHRHMMVATNNINIAGILAVNPECEIILSGGVLRRSDGGLVGTLAIETIERFKFDIAVIGCSALDGEGDILDFDIQEVGVSRSIIAQARRTFLVADHSKFQRNAPARIASLDVVERFYTDRPLPEALARRCAEWQTEVIVCPPAD